MIYLVYCVLLLITIYFYLRWICVKQYWANLNVPHKAPSIYNGNLTFFMRKSVFSWLRDYNVDFKCPYFGIWLLWKPALVVNSPELARLILLRDADAFRNRLMDPPKTDLSSKGLLFTKNSTHTSLKRHFTPAYTTARVNSFQNVLSAKSLELVQRVSIDSNQGKLIELRTMFADFTTDVFSITSLGMNGEATLTGDSPIRRITKEYTKFDFLRNISWGSITLFPEIAEFFRFEFFPKNSIANLRDICKSAIEKRREEAFANTNGVEDFFSFALKINNGTATSQQDVEEMALAQVAIFLQAGYDTPSLTLTYATYELAFNSHIQERLYSELKEAKDNIGEFDSRILSKLNYLNSIIKETFRKYPPIPMLDRVTTKNYEISENLIITEGTPVFVNLVAIHYDPEVYKDPEEFNPDRFLPENEHKLKPFTLLPFGDGPRYCIGKRLGLDMIRYGLAQLLLNYEIHPLPNTPKPAECEYGKNLILLVPDSPRCVNFVQRVK